MSHRTPKKSPTYNSWNSMRQRCNNENREDYKYYGMIGVTYAPEWDKFENFLADVGVRPEGTTLDRIDPFGNYEPSNVRWATPEQQANNQRRFYAGTETGV